MLPCDQPETAAYSALLAESFSHWTGQKLIDPFSAHALYHAPFVLVSHGTQADPVFRYANLAAQKLWELNWEEFTAMPSRLSAEPVSQEERQRLLDAAARDGYIADYSGVRISKSGTRFRIEDTILWNVVDKTGRLHGQAATFSKWTPL